MIVQSSRAEPVGFSCDRCPAGHQTEHAALKPALEELKGLRWIVRLIDGVWRHFCPDCRAEMNKTTGRGLL